jgi:hypothetical protein
VGRRVLAQARFDARVMLSNGEQLLLLLVLPALLLVALALTHTPDLGAGRRIDIAICDYFYSPLIFPHESGFLVPAESVYAIVEVKQVPGRVRPAPRRSPRNRRMPSCGAPPRGHGAIRRPRRDELARAGPTHHRA